VTLRCMAFALWLLLCFSKGRRVFRVRTPPGRFSRHGDVSSLMFRKPTRNFGRPVSNPLPFSSCFSSINLPLRLASGGNALLISIHLYEIYRSKILEIWSCKTRIRCVLASSRMWETGGGCTYNKYIYIYMYV